MKGTKIAPFRGLLYHQEKAGDLSRVVAPPYDVISPSQQGRLYERDPYNVVRLILGKQHPEDTNQNNRYTRAAADLKKWIQEGILVRDPEPAFYLYEQEFMIQEKRRKRRGVIALRRLEDFGQSIHRHEKTLEGPKRDRFQLITHCHANLSPIFSLYEDPQKEVVSLLDPYYGAVPFLEAVDDDQTFHRLWRLTEPALLKKISERLAVKGMFIADGHHRYEIGLAYRDWMKKRYLEAGEDASFHYIMMFCAEVSDPGLVILPTHRLVLRSSVGFATLMARLREKFEIHSFSREHLGLFLENFPVKADRRGFGLVLGQGAAPYHFVELPPSDLLDVQWVHQSVLREILGFTESDEKNPERIAYIKDQQELLALVEREPNHFGILLSAPSPVEVFGIAQKGTVLPPKSTYFFPKLLSGLVLNPIYPEERVIT